MLLRIIANLIVFFRDFAPQPRPGQVCRLSLEAVLIHQPRQQLLVDIRHSGVSGYLKLCNYCIEWNKLNNERQIFEYFIDISGSNIFCNNHSRLKTLGLIHPLPTNFIRQPFIILTFFCFCFSSVIKWLFFVPRTLTFSDLLWIIWAPVNWGP